MRKICVVTGSRADYGLLVPLMKEIQDDSALTLQLVATGSHLLSEFGNTGKNINSDGFQIAALVHNRLEGDTPVQIAKAIGTGVIRFSEALSELNPDLLVLLGDRYEVFSAACAAVPLRIPIAHIHGGETSEGAIDEAFRHAMTKMAHLHFAAAETYKNRVIQMGENPAFVYCFGAPGLDVLKKIKLLDRNSLAAEIGLTLKSRFFVVTYHPVTLEKQSADSQTLEIIKAIEAFPDAEILFTLPNADSENSAIRRRIYDYQKKAGPRVAVSQNLGTQNYLSALSHADLVLGNSSSGLIEAPSFKCPAVNIGDRQKGRLQADSVIQCDPESSRIIAAIETALNDPDFRAKLAHTVNPYFGEGNASKKIKDVLKDIPLDERILKKKFFDLHEKAASLV